MHSCAQTNIQLFNQLRHDGYSTADLNFVRDAYELAMVFFPVAFSRRENPSLRTSWGPPASSPRFGCPRRSWRQGCCTMFTRPAISVTVVMASRRPDAEGSERLWARRSKITLLNFPRCIGNRGRYSLRAKIRQDRPDRPRGSLDLVRRPSGASPGS